VAAGSRAAERERASSAHQCGAAWFDENLKNEGDRNMLTMANQAVVDDDVREFLPEDYIPEEVGNLVREGSSSTANQRDRSNSADPTDAELAMRMRLTWVQDKAVLFHCNAGGKRSPFAAAMLPPFAVPGSSWEQVDNQMQRSLGGVVQSGGSSSSSSSSGRGQVGNQIEDID